MFPTLQRSFSFSFYLVLFSLPHFFFSSYISPDFLFSSFSFSFVLIPLQFTVITPSQFIHGFVLSTNTSYNTPEGCRSRVRLSNISPPPRFSNIETSLMRVLVLFTEEVNTILQNRPSHAISRLRQICTDNLGTTTCRHWRNCRCSQSRSSRA